MTPKQEAFVREYLVDLNATQAAIRAGYSAKTANVQAVEIMARPEMKAALDAAIEARAKRTEMTADRVLQELAKIVFANIADFTTVVGGERVVDLTTEDRDLLAAISEIQVDEYKEGRGEDAREVKRTKFKLHDKMSSITLAMRHLGMLNDKLQVSDPEGKNPFGALMEMVAANGRPSPSR